MPSPHSHPRDAEGSRSEDPPLDRLRDGLAKVLIGQEEAATGLRLALLARQHAYLEGPPGCGKSVLAAALARLSGARSVVVAFHRDIRETDLLGDVLLRRRVLTPLPGSPTHWAGGERLERTIEPGALLGAEVALLEDLPRAPGEALGPLLRILAERRALGRSLPLEWAVATAPSIEREDAGDAPIDPLEPSQLDRFAIQLRLHGLVGGRRWNEARRLLERISDPESPFGNELAPVLTSEERHQLQERSAALPITRAALDAYHELLDRLRQRAGAAGGAALLTDRAFGGVALSVFRAHALDRGGQQVEPRDLRAIRFMVARRLPEQVQTEIPALLDEVIEEAPIERIEVGGADLVTSPAFAGEGTPTDTPRTGGAVIEEDTDFDLEPERGAGFEPAEVQPLLDALIGSIERGRVDPDSDPGGQPRSYRPLRHLDELFDADPIEVLLFSEGRLPGNPRTYERQRRNAGGALVILRDVSASMAGQLAEWAGQVVAGVVKVAAQRRMRVGYIEFHHKAIDHPIAGRLLHRSYPRLLELSRTARTLGQTNYEAPLRLALEGLRGGMGRNRHVVMLTDGLPIIGDPTVRRERALARRLGVSLHTVFLGAGPCPVVLDELSEETQGLRFQARPGEGRRLSLSERH